VQQVVVSCRGPCSATASTCSATKSCQHVTKEQQANIGTSGKACGSSVQAGITPHVGDITWTQTTTIVYPMICSLAGVIAGMFGVGGGIVKGPLMLALGLLPDVAAATSATMILFTACARPPAPACRSATLLCHSTAHIVQLCSMRRLVSPAATLIASGCSCATTLQAARPRAAVSVVLCRRRHMHCAAAGAGALSCDSSACVA
jgi:hypothetical protein